MTSPLFNPPPSNLKLNDDGIHVWKVGLDQPVSIIQTLVQTLSKREKKRAERFQFEKDRRRFVIGRGVLRSILGHYLTVDPSRLQFCYGKNGKPSLVDTSGSESIRFNLSKSSGLVLFGFSRNREIGVDIENIRDIPDMEQIAERFFSVRENSIFRSLPKSKRKEAFYNCWTRKEAFIKAIGDGLARALNTFDVTLAPGEPAELINIVGDLKEAAYWSIHALTPTPGYVGAIAVKGYSWPVAYWQWAEY